MGSWIPCRYQATMVSGGPDTEQLRRKSLPSSWNTTSGGEFTNSGGSEIKGEYLKQIIFFLINKLLIIALVVNGDIIVHISI